MSSSVASRRSVSMDTALVLMSEGGMTFAAPPPPGMSRLPVIASIRQMQMQAQLPSFAWSPMPLPYEMPMGLIVPIMRAIS